MTRPARPRPVLRSPERLGGVIDRAEPHARAYAKPNVSMRDWIAAVGARIAERAEPVEIDRGTLIVRVANSVWASELSLLAVTILQRLEAVGAPVHALRYRVGTIEGAPRPKAFRASRAVPAPLPLPASVSAALANVDDDELRQIIGNAAQANLAWQAYVDPGTAPATPATSRAARVPRSAEPESGPPGQTTAGDPGGARRRP